MVMSIIIFLQIFVCNVNNVAIDSCHDDLGWLQ